VLVTSELRASERIAPRSLDDGASNSAGGGTPRNSTSAWTRAMEAKTRGELESDDGPARHRPAYQLPDARCAAPRPAPGSPAPADPGMGPDTVHAGNRGYGGMGGRHLGNGRPHSHHLGGREVVGSGTWSPGGRIANSLDWAIVRRSQPPQGLAEKTRAARIAATTRAAPPLARARTGTMESATGIYGEDWGVLYLGRFASGPGVE